MLVPDPRLVVRRLPVAAALDCALVYGRAEVVMAPRGGDMIYCRRPGVPDAIYDGCGTVLDTLEMQYAGEPGEDARDACLYALAADLWGDSREEVILFGCRGACIYANARPAAIPTLYNETLYPGA